MQDDGIMREYDEATFWIDEKDARLGEWAFVITNDNDYARQPWDAHRAVKTDAGWFRYRDDCKLEFFHGVTHYLPMPPFPKKPAA